MATREVATGEEGIAEARRETPSLVVLDVCLPGVSGYEVCRAIRECAGERVPILFVSGARTEPYDRVAGLELGGDDYLVKPFAHDELLARVRCLLRRQAPLGAPIAGLTVREQQILRLLAYGKRQDEIARELVISPRTVATHIERILGKLGVHSRAEAVALAYRHGLVPVPL